jgi:hypothetical protein
MHPHTRFLCFIEGLAIGLYQWTAVIAVAVVVAAMLGHPSLASIWIAQAATQLPIAIVLHVACRKARGRA